MFRKSHSMYRPFRGCTRDKNAFSPAAPAVLLPGRFLPEPPLPPFAGQAAPPRAESGSAVLDLLKYCGGFLLQPNDLFFRGRFAVPLRGEHRKASVCNCNSVFPALTFFFPQKAHKKTPRLWDVSLCFMMFSCSSRSSSCTSCRCRRGRDRCGRASCSPSASGGRGRCSRRHWWKAAPYPPPAWAVRWAAP